MKRLTAVVLSVLLSMTLVACGGITEEDVSVYIRGEMDSCYLGQYNQDYLELMDYTEEYAAENYAWNVGAEAERLLDFLDVRYYDDAVLADAEELVRKIYMQSRYTVGDTNKLKDGNFTTEILVEPIELMYLVTEELLQDVYYEVCGEAGIIDDTQISALTDEAYNQLEIQYAFRMLETLEELLPKISHGAQQSVMIQMKLGEDKNYSLVDSSWSNMDDLIIDYYGEYLTE